MNSDAKDIAATVERSPFAVKAPFLQRLKRWARFFACLVILIAGLALIGWQFDIDLLKRPMPRLVAMNPLTAILFIFCGVSILVFTAKKLSPHAILYGKILAAVVLLAGLLRLIPEIFNLDIPVDRILFNAALREDVSGNISNRMAPNTAVGFVLSGIALLLFDFETRRKKIPAQYLAFVIALFGLLSIVGYLYRVKVFYGLLVYIPMAIHSAICFVFLSLSILFVHPSKGMMKELTGPFDGSFIARFLVPAAIIIPVLLGFIRMWGTWEGFLSFELGAVLLIISIVIIFLILSWFIIVSLNKRDKLKQEAENALRESEKRVQTIFNEAPDAVIVIDEEGKIINWNPKAESLFGWKQDEVLGRPLSDIIIPAQFREAHKKGLKHFLRTGEGPLIGKVIETSALTKSNTELDVALNIAVTPKIKGRHLFIGFVRDITEQKKAEKKFESLLEAAPDAMVIANQKGEIVLVNQQTEALFGYTRNELIGKPVEILIPADFQSRHEGHRDQYFTDPKVRAMGAGIELKAIKKDGTSFPVEISLSPIQTEEGLLVSASVRDITDRKKEEEKFRSLLEAAPDAMIIANAKGEIILINHQTEVLFGYKKEELICRQVEILIPGDLYKKHTEHRNNYFKQPKVRSMGAGLELYAVRKNGSQFPVEISLSPLETGEGLLVSAAIRDITERKHIQIQLQKKKQEIQDFIDSMSTLCAKVTTGGKLLVVNKTAQMASGLSMEELMSTNFLEGKWWTFDPEVHSRVCDAFKKACCGTSINYDENIFVFDQVLTINFSLTPILTPEGRVDYIVAEGRDITPLKLTEAELRKRTDQLETANSELDAFTYSVSHDLRAPLRGIIGFTAILEEDYSSQLDDEAKRITSVIKGNTMKMGHLIDDLLAFSRMGKQELLKTRLNMEAMVKEIVDELVQQNNKANINWEIQPLPSVNADLNMIRQAWINLISNAMKYSSNKKRPYIIIGAYELNGQTVFRIKDNGIGFDEQYKDKLFKVFQRLHGSEEFEGTGVGLALVEKIISRHGGKVWAEGKVDEGACFYFSLSK